MRPVQTFAIVPALPAGLERLSELAFNLRWAWDHETIDLFRRLDADLWEASGHSPVLMLGTIAQERLEAAAADDGFLAQYRRVCDALDYYLADQSTWYHRSHRRDGLRIGYFSLEFGLTECVPLYSGGLGILAGDHLKSASDLGLPVAGVGLLYQQGYFRQSLNADGWQRETPVDNDFYTMPLSLERRAGGTPVTVEVSFPGRAVAAQVWRVQVGRVPLYLLDTNLPVNRPDDRDITGQLYGGDTEMRIRQEIVLGIGGLRVLDAVGRRPAVCHLNEGHAAFAALERIRLLMVEEGLTFAEAAEAASPALIFTTHTPVPAGHDYFPPELINAYLGEYYPLLGLSNHEFLALGRRSGAGHHDPFCMTILALRLCAHRNAVSRLHGQVTRKVWQCLWPGVPEQEVPITSITNGVHFPSWISHDFARLYDRYLGPRWREGPANGSVWPRVEDIPAEELWHTHERRRERLVAFARRRVRAQLQRRGASPAEAAQADEVLDPGALTLGFSRRFATYKRATLLLRDPDRLAALLNHPEHPAQIIFAGKAHPRDDAGKALIREIIHLSREERFRRRIVFLEDYDVTVARYMVQGCDLWINTPRRTLEASGTSGMKATANGVLNLSTMGGWWDEAYSPAVGWAITTPEDPEDEAACDEAEARVLYDLLGQEVVPLFYERGRDRLPRGWIARMKQALRTLCPAFSAGRMAQEYAESYYLPAFERWRRLSDERLERARALAAWKAQVKERWPAVRVEGVAGLDGGEVRVGSSIQVWARVGLGGLSPEDLTVQIYAGRLDASGTITAAAVTAMEPVEAHNGTCVFLGEMVARSSGRHGLTVRVLPRHPDLAVPHDMGLIIWAG